MEGEGTKPPAFINFTANKSGVKIGEISRKKFFFDFEEKPGQKMWNLMLAFELSCTFEEGDE